jgi:hypothetical protein
LTTGAARISKWRSAGAPVAGLHLKQSKSPVPRIGLRVALKMAKTGFAFLGIIAIILFALILS